MRDQEFEAVLPAPETKWRGLAAFLAEHVAPGELILAPHELIHVCSGLVAFHVRKSMVGDASFSAYVLEREKLDQVDPAFLADAAAGAALYADEWFAVFALGARGSLAAEHEAHLAPYRAAMQAATAAPEGGVAAAITTHDRPWALARTLRSLRRAFRRVVVVDDASTRWNAWRNRRAARIAGADYLRIPRNLGVAHAVNIGVAHWLAHPEIDWISVFNDDVEMTPGGLETLMAVSRAAPYPRDAVLLSGYKSPFHRVQRGALMAGHAVLLARSASGQHLHAHRTHWQKLLPVPTAYLGAPKQSGGRFAGHGSDMDWWIASWSPKAAIKNGGEVVVIPGLVETFGKGRSTWGAPGV
jgi:hypothetical protein